MEWCSILAHRSKSVNMHHFFLETTIQFIGNSEANDGITYWAPNVPSITVLVTSTCSTNGTHLFTISGDVGTLYDSVLTLGENCASCECTTVESTVSVSRQCVAGNEQVSLSTRLSGISSDTKAFSVRYNNGTNDFVKESQYRSMIVFVLYCFIASMTNVTNEDSYVIHLSTVTRSYHRWPAYIWWSSVKKYLSLVWLVINGASTAMYVYQYDVASVPLITRLLYTQI